jgi:hypothetical protein
VDQDIALQGRFHVGDDGQLFPLRFDERHGVLGLAARLGDHRGDRLALPARAADRDRVLRRRLDALQVAEHRHPRRAVLGDLGAVEDGDDAFRLRCLLETQLLYAGMRVGAAEESDMREARKAKVVRERAASLQQALCIGARDALPDVPLVDLRPGGVKRELGLTHSFLH